MKHISHKQYKNLIEEYRAHIDELDDPYAYILSVIARIEAAGRRYRESQVKDLWDDEKGSIYVTKMLVELHYVNNPCIVEASPSVFEMMGTSRRLKVISVQMDLQIKKIRQSRKETNDGN